MYFVCFPYFRLQSVSVVRFDRSSILVPSVTRFSFQDHVTKKTTGSVDENALLVLGHAQRRRDPKSHPEFRTRVTRKKGYGEKIMSRMSLSCISFFRPAVEIGARTRIKFKSLWTFSFWAPFVFLELLWFTLLVNFTGSYIEDKPKFFCDCPTDVSLRSLLPTCFLFLSSFFSLPGIY